MDPTPVSDAANDGSSSVEQIRESLGDRNGSCRTRFGTFSECPLCGSELSPEHAHFKCRGCGWRDSCCD